MDYKGYQIIVEEDDNFNDYLEEMPTDDSPELFLVSYHRDFHVEHPMFSKEEVQNLFSTLEHPDYWVFPLRLYSHSGVQLSLSNQEYPFNCRFDSCWSGLVFVSKEEFSEEQSREAAENHVKYYNSILSNEVYAFIIKNDQGNILDTCGGFVGDREHCLESAKEIVDSYGR
jgi:hypothetical protein